MKQKVIIFTTILLIVIQSAYQSANAYDIPKREFVTSFESVADFSGFYITPQGHLGSTFHEKSSSNVYHGNYAHKAWVTQANLPSTPSLNNNHRGYPTIQLHKTAEGSFRTPCLITLWVWLDMPLSASDGSKDDDWFSFATFTDDESDHWARTVLVNLSHDGFVHLQHTPQQGQQEYIFQTKSLRFPQKEWVELKIYLDFTDTAYAKVWQNGELVSHAKIEDINNQLAQAHFGLYCSPEIQSGTVYNDALRIKEVSGE